MQHGAMTQRTPLRTLDGQAIGAFAFGTMQYGGRADKKASDAMYADCRAAGLRHFDTAFVYTDGASEDILGAQVASEREVVFVASKVGYIRVERVPRKPSGTIRDQPSPPEHGCGRPTLSAQV